MKCTIALTLIICLRSIAGDDSLLASRTILQQQKFLFEIVHRLQNPLEFPEWLAHGNSLVLDANAYVKFDHAMKKYGPDQLEFQLPKAEFFAALLPTHMRLAKALFKFFYYAKSWETFQENVCWARQHVNEGMFVMALNLAVLYRSDCEHLIMPAIYEMLPQHFFNSKLIYKGLQFNYDAVQKHSNSKTNRDKCQQPHWKAWQWWKWMGIDDKWHAEPLRNIDDVNIFWTPVDFTRDISIHNEESALSYFTEDVDWNANWYYHNLENPVFLQKQEFIADVPEQIENEQNEISEWWLYMARTFVARYNMARLSHGMPKLEEFTDFGKIKTGYNPQMISWNGVTFQQRQNNHEIIQKKELHHEVLLKPNYTQVADALHGRIDADFLNPRLMSIFMHASELNSLQLNDVYPNVLLNYETMARDPIFYSILKAKFLDTLDLYQHRLPPYTREELQLKGVEIVDANVTELITYFDYTDIDISNLLSEKMHFIEEVKYQWNLSLFARQNRLKHKPFSYNITVESLTKRAVTVRTYLGPRYDKFARVISMNENRWNFMQFDEFVTVLDSGRNLLERDSATQFLSHKDCVTYTEMYRRVLLALEHKYEYVLNDIKPHCSLPDRIVLPKGWTQGMPMQMFFVITPIAEVTDDVDRARTEGVRSGKRSLDNLPFGYPFDRKIDELEFVVPNMYAKFVKIYHENRLEKYQEEYENLQQSHNNCINK